MKRPQQQEDLYLLGYRRDNVEEDRRLNSQHHDIKHAILEGHLIHPSIPKSQITAIADLACGTGVWLEDTASTLFADRKPSTADGSSPFLIGFDVNAHAFNPHPTHNVQLVQHDCTKPFDLSYIGRFDLVNMRGLAYALTSEAFSHVIDNAIQLLRPGGYLQWLETETRLFKVYPETPEITEALSSINSEREERQLAPYLPHFMLRQLLSTNSESIALQPSGHLLTILHFNLLPGGISREGRSDDTTLNNQFSETVLETVKLLLKSAWLRQESLETDEESGGKNGTREDQMAKFQGLMDFVDQARGSDNIKMGGFFPQLIARKSTSL